MSEKEDACTGKVAFGSFQLALEVLDRSRRRHDVGRNGIYKCQSCCKWHIGRKFQRDKKNPKRRMIDKAEAA